MTPTCVDFFSSMNATHQESFVSSPPSIMQARTNATEELNTSLIDVSSTEETVPPTRLSGRISSVHANRSVAKHKPSKIGDVRLIMMAKNGADNEEF
mmetsp:Transcript_8593/g.17857  ORF Transcript_8593/g.17857 Transcript_8593/m.17857 type:complete len:97 (+) Transcript_8593:214-504(+)